MSNLLGNLIYLPMGLLIIGFFGVALNKLDKLRMARRRAALNKP
jgi:hypothetical protein